MLFLKFLWIYINCEAIEGLLPVHFNFWETPVPQKVDYMNGTYNRTWASIWFLYFI